MWLEIKKKKERNGENNNRKKKIDYVIEKKIRENTAEIL